MYSIDCLKIDSKLSLTYRNIYLHNIISIHLVLYDLAGDIILKDEPDIKKPSINSSPPT